MKIERNLLIIVCIVIFVMFMCHKQSDIEGFVTSPCQHYNVGTSYGDNNELKQQIGKPGLDVMNEKLNTPSHRASWIRKPSPVFKYHCDNFGCKWEKIYDEFYPNLRGNQENMIKP